MCEVLHHSIGTVVHNSLFSNMHPFSLFPFPLPPSLSPSLLFFFLSLPSLSLSLLPSLQMTRVSYPICLLASICGLLPTQMLNTYMGSTVRNMQEVLADRVDGYIILSAQVIMSIFLMLYLLRKARSELAKLTQQVDLESGNVQTTTTTTSTDR